MGIFDKAREWRKKRQEKIRDKVNQKVAKELPQEAGPRYSLMDQIKKTPYYHKSAMNADEKARAFLTENIQNGGAGNIHPGQLILFEYFEPKTKEELEYYDASPCTIFFNVITTKEGKRVLGFNMHYYPPKMRQRIMTTIFDIYKPIYTKYFTNGKKINADAFDYKYLIDSLEKAGLGFGVRMYIPNLIGKIYKIPPQMWHVAVFTEGWFKKQTRTAILKYWQRWTRNAEKKAARKAARNKRG